MGFTITYIYIPKKSGFKHFFANFFEKVFAFIWENR
jgi:hypothetical protein